MITWIVFNRFINLDYMQTTSRYDIAVMALLQYRTVARFPVMTYRWPRWWGEFVNCGMKGNRTDSEHLFINMWLPRDQNLVGRSGGCLRMTFANRRTVPLKCFNEFNPPLTIQTTFLKNNDWLYETCMIFRTLKRYSFVVQDYSRMSKELFV